MKSIILLVIFSLSSGFFSNVQADEAGFKEGKWAITSTMKVQGQIQTTSQASLASGTVESHSMTTQECITKDNPVPGMKELTQKLQGCQPPVINVDGGIIDYAVNCSGTAGQMALSGRLNFKGDTMEGVATMGSTSKDKQMGASTQIQGKYIGPC